jgi:hypothetical protein
MSMRSWSGPMTMASSARAGVPIWAKAKTAAQISKARKTDAARKAERQWSPPEEALVIRYGPLPVSPDAISRANRRRPLQTAGDPARCC